MWGGSWRRWRETVRVEWWCGGKARVLYWWSAGWHSCFITWWVFPRHRAKTSYKPVWGNIAVKYFWAHKADVCRQRQLCSPDSLHIACDLGRVEADGLLTSSSWQSQVCTPLTVISRFMLFSQSKNVDAGMAAIPVLAIYWHYGHSNDTYQSGLSILFYKTQLQQTCPLSLSKGRRCICRADAASQPGNTCVLQNASIDR